MPGGSSAEVLGLPVPPPGKWRVIAELVGPPTGKFATEEKLDASGKQRSGLNLDVAPGLPAGLRVYTPATGIEGLWLEPVEVCAVDSAPPHTQDPVAD
eukprot:gene826-14799_t